MGPRAPLVSLGKAVSVTDAAGSRLLPGGAASFSVLLGREATKPEVDLAVQFTHGHGKETEGKEM